MVIVLTKILTKWRKFSLIVALTLVNGVAFACQPVNDEEFIICNEGISKISNNDPRNAIEKLEGWKSNLSKFNVANQISYYESLSTIYSESGKYSASEKTARKGLSLAKLHKIYTTDVIGLIYNVGFATEIKGQVESAGKWYKEGLERAKELDHLPTIIEGHLNVGAYYYQTNKLKKSLSEITIAKELSLALPDNLKGIEVRGEVAGELGNLYGRMGKESKSIAYQLEAINYFKQLDKTDFVLIGYLNLASTYIYIRDYDNAEKIYALLFNESTAYQYKHHYFNGLTGLANLKIELGLWDEAYQLLVKAEAIIDSVEQTDSKVILYTGIAKVSMELDRFQLSDKALKDAGNFLLNADKGSSRRLALVIMKTRAELLARTGKAKEAYALQSKYVQNYIGLRKINTNKVVEEMRVKFETKQTEIENASLTQKNILIEKARVEQEKNIIGLIILLLILLALIAYQFILKKRLTIAATTDGLTKAMNRRFLSEKGRRAFDSASNGNGPLSVIMLDVDHFKNINDNYGHNVGDEVLKAVSKVSQSAMRDGDYFGRWGGEEFVAVLPGANNESASKVAERIAKAFADHDWSENGLDYTVTVSIGVLSCTTMSEPEGFPSLVDQADAAMYRAKRGGRNRIVTAEWLSTTD